MTLIRLPVEYDNVDLSSKEDNVFWKQIIPLDREISYGGKKLRFGKTLLERIKANYEAGVTDQTAFQLADDQNRHDTEEDVAKQRNFDPQRYRGDIQALKLVETGEVPSRGLWGKFKLTDDGLKAIKDNPRLGVSASIKPDYIGEDGTKHDFVLRHVVGTLDPKIKHMSPWQREDITLSQDDDPNEEVYDLTTTEPAPADTQTPNTSDDSKVSVDKTEYEKMQSDLAEYNKGEALLEQILNEPDEETNLSEVSVDPRITELQNRAAASEWKAERTELVKSGVPVAMLNLCDGVMSTYEAPTINLSDGESVDPRDVIRKVLEEAKGTVDLSAESGHGMTVDERNAEKQAADDFIGGFISEYNVDLF